MLVGHRALGFDIVTTGQLREMEGVKRIKVATDGDRLVGRKHLMPRIRRLETFIYSSIKWSKERERRSQNVPLFHENPKQVGMFEILECIGDTFVLQVIVHLVQVVLLGPFLSCLAIFVPVKKAGDPELTPRRNTCPCTSTAGVVMNICVIESVVEERPLPRRPKIKRYNAWQKT